MILGAGVVAYILGRARRPPREGPPRLPHVAREMGGAVTAAWAWPRPCPGRGGRAVGRHRPRPSRATAGGFELHLFRCRFCPWRWGAGLGRWLAREVRWADVVHLHTLWTYPTWAAARASRRGGVPYVLRPAGMLEEW